MLLLKGEMIKRSSLLAVITSHSFQTQVESIRLALDIIDGSVLRNCTVSVERVLLATLPCGWLCFQQSIATPHRPSLSRRESMTPRRRGRKPRRKAAGRQSESLFFPSSSWVQGTCSVLGFWTGRRGGLMVLLERSVSGLLSSKMSLIQKTLT